MVSDKANDVRLSGWRDGSSNGECYSQQGGVEHKSSSPHDLLCTNHAQTDRLWELYKEQVRLFAVSL